MEVWVAAVGVQHRYHYWQHVEVEQRLGWLYGLMPISSAAVRSGFRCARRSQHSMVLWTVCKM